MSVVVRGQFLKDAHDFFDALPEVAESAAMMAINQVAERDGLAMMRKDIESQVAFPAGYLKRDDRLGVTRKATRKSLEAVVTGRDRATSLARFAAGQTPSNTRRKGVRVQVKKGGPARHLDKAWLVSLNNGNIGLATRDKRLLSRAYKPVLLDRGVFLLYGPSVDQVFGTVAQDSLPEIGRLLSKEFYRQFARLTRG